MGKKAQTSAKADNLPEEIQKIKAAFDKVFDNKEYKDRREKMYQHKQLYLSELWPDGQDKSYSRVQINYIFSNIEQAAPLLTDNRPIWHLQARSPRFQKLAGLYDRALEYLWDFREMDDRTFDEVKDSLLFGKAITKVFWNDEEDEVDFELIDPSTFCLAPGYKDLWKAPWCGERGRKALSWIRTVFPDEWMNVKPEGSSFETERNLQETQSIELESLFADVYQVWFRDDEMVDEMIKIQESAYDHEGKEYKVDKEKKSGKYKKKYPNGRLLVFTATAVLQDIPSPFDHGKPPYADLSNYKVNHEFWSMGEVEQIRELHRELNTQFQALVRQGRVGENPNYTFIADLIDMDADQLKEVFFEGGNFFPVANNPEGKSPISRIETGGIDKKHLELMQVLRRAIREMSSQTEITEGIPAKKERQSATEIGAMLESSFTRVRQKVRNLEFFIKRKNWLTVSLMQQYYDEPRFISFQQESDEGQQVAWAVVSNQRATAVNHMKPEREENEPEEEYVARLAGDEDYNSFLPDEEEGEKDLDPIYFPFQVQIQSSSTLPKDQQSLANLYLKLGAIQVTPASPVDIEAILTALQVPDAQAIIARKEKEKQEMMKMKQQQAMPPPKRGPGPVIQRQGA